MKNSSIYSIFIIKSRRLYYDKLDRCKYTRKAKIRFAAKIKYIRAEILHIEKQIKKIVGKNEIARQEKLKSKKSGQTEIVIKNFEAFKDKYRRVSNIHFAVNAMKQFIGGYGYSNKEGRAPVKVMK